ncbi:hypothetical protein TNCV_4406461 [Trichonephila clavipes]|nr:hypothetical protein TNCV_4406461 [Trichonephila clavipes]
MEELGERKRNESTFFLNNPLVYSNKNYDSLKTCASIILILSVRSPKTLIGNKREDELSLLSPAILLAQTPHRFFFLRLHNCSERYYDFSSRYSDEDIRWSESDCEESEESEDANDNIPVNPDRYIYRDGT